MLECLVNPVEQAARGEPVGDSVSDSMTLPGNACMPRVVTAGPRPSCGTSGGGGGGVERPGRPISFELETASWRRVVGSTSTRET